MADFGKYLHAMRKKRDLTVHQLATHAGVSPSLISRIENGKRGAPKVETLDKLAEGLRVSRWEIYYMAGAEGVLKDADFTLSETAFDFLSDDERQKYKQEKEKKEREQSVEKQPADPFDDLESLSDEYVWFKDFERLSPEDKQKVIEHIQFLRHLAEKENNE